jgi:site-specific DNA recombinase
MEQVSIRYVADYIRKSRGESDSDLENHRLILKELCEKNGWTSVEYSEIETGDSLSMRPEMQRLLSDVTNGVYDAVCVVDIDRLGRGDLGDQDKIKKAFAKSGTLIVTPQHIYNLDNENDEFAVDIKSFIARQEYKQIVRRLTQGKRVGARRGHWTNGTPPYPYEYERWGDKYNPKGLVVNDEKLSIYRFMVDATVKRNMHPLEIAYELNKMGVPSPRGGDWSNVAIYRLMLNETHLGWIVSNKTTGDGHARKKESAKEVKKIPKSNWSIVKDRHEAVKTQEEHNAIKLFYSGFRVNQKRKPNEIRGFTGLIKCGLCGKTMGTQIRHGKEDIRWCWYVSPTGIRCGNAGGVITNEFYKKIIQKLEERKETLEKSLNDDLSQKAKEKLQNEIDLVLDGIKNKKKSLNRIVEAYEDGVYTLAQYKERKEKTEGFIQSLEDKVEILKLQMKERSNEFKEEKLNEIERAIRVLKEDVDSNIRNRALKKVIEKILWTRTKSTYEAKFVFK